MNYKWKYTEMRHFNNENLHCHRNIEHKYFKSNNDTLSWKYICKRRRNILITEMHKDKLEFKSKKLHITMQLQSTD
jgi:hypothetical protein